MAIAIAATYHIGMTSEPITRKIAAKIRPRMLTTCPPRAGQEPLGMTQQPAPPQQLPISRIFRLALKFLLGESSLRVIT